MLFLLLLLLFAVFIVAVSVLAVVVIVAAVYIVVFIVAVIFVVVVIVAVAVYCCCYGSMQDGAGATSWLAVLRFHLLYTDRIRVLYLCSGRRTSGLTSSRRELGRVGEAPPARRVQEGANNLQREQG